MLPTMLMFRPLVPDDSDENDVQFCQRLTIEAGVTAIPVRIHCSYAVCPLCIYASLLYLLSRA